MLSQSQTKTVPEGRSERPLKVSDLIPSGKVLELDHEGQIYRLRVTRNRKLILTK